MEIKNIFQQIESVFAKHRLIGNKNFSEDDYSLMVDFVSIICSKFLSDKHYRFDKMDYKLIFVTLVEIVKRWKEYDSVEDNEEKCGLWLHIFKTISGKDGFDQKLYSEFTNVISQMGSQNLLPVVKTGNKYYATLMMHSFAPKNNIFSFFDLCYNVFKKDLDFGFTSDDEWLCKKVADEMRTVLGGEYREEKKISIGIGSSAYSIKIGLRSFAMNEDLSDDFIEFIKDTFYQINKLFNREIINEDTRLKRYVIEWWKSKTDFDKFSNDTIRKERIPTVSKQNIAVKYIKNDNEVFLCIPSIRLDDSNSLIWLMVYVNGKQAHSEKMETKRGELVIATKPVKVELDDLLNSDNSINIKIEIKENQTIIFDSEKKKATSLNREFLLFEGDREILSQINKPTNYFVYSKNIDGLKSIPDNLTAYGANLYNIYPNAGESLIGETKQVFFVNKEKSVSLGKNACLIGSLSDVEWILDDISCVVYRNNVKLMIPENANLKALKLKIDSKVYNLHDINYERIESNCYQFGLRALGLIDEYYPTQVSLFSYEKKTTLLKETVIILPNLNIQFNKPFYFGDIERKVIIAYANENNEFTWTNQDNEVICPIKEGILVIKVPYLKWRLNNKEWRNQSINTKIWYKDLLENGDLLEINNPMEDELTLIEGKADGIPFEIPKNQNGKFEIGRAIYANENKQDISIYFISRNKEKFELVNVATKEHFVNTPLIYTEGKVLWDVENTFIGDENNEFLLIAESKYKNKENKREKVGSSNIEFGNFNEDIYKIIVKIKDRNIFLGEKKYDTIFEGKFLVGSPEKLRFKEKILYIDKISASFSDVDSLTWIQPYSKYIIKDLEYIENSYYQGNLGIIREGKIAYLNSMENEDGEWDKINPVRIELRSNNSFWMVAGYDNKNSDFLGELIFDKRCCGLCNTNSKDSKRYVVVNLYKFKEEEYV